MVTPHVTAAHGASSAHPTALELARSVKGKLVELTGLSPEYMYIATPTGQEKDTRRMDDYGFAGSEDADASLLAEEAYGAFEEAITMLIQEGVPLQDRFDQTHGCELVFYDE